MSTIDIVWVSQINRKHEPMPEAALVSSEGKWCSWTFTDYTMGISKPHFPVPATRADSYWANRFTPPWWNPSPYWKAKPY